MKKNRSWEGLFDSLFDVIITVLILKTGGMEIAFLVASVYYINRMVTISKQ